MKLEVIRREYLADRTLGRLEIDGEFFCHTLEDKVRPPGEKVYGETAIPEGTYLVTLKPFRGDKNKIYPYLHDVPMSTGVFMHGGNKPEDSLGCILVGFKRNGDEIYESAIKALVARIQAANGPVWLTVRNGG